MISVRHALLYGEDSQLKLAKGYLLEIQLTIASWDRNCIAVYMEWTAADSNQDGHNNNIAHCYIDGYRDNYFVERVQSFSKTFKCIINARWLVSVH